ncbi:MAG: hypothetical protein Ct9H90mP20_1270 [Candidatus Neomarinimicrobiota bacterium]|nr:MAG: hypothetical protein Ct9H90mP20_1270 [Candidatus Neomarinimicrobiota bacterium]
MAKARKVDFLQGKAMFRSNSEVEVGNGKKKEVLSFDRALLLLAHPLLCCLIFLKVKIFLPLKLHLNWRISQKPCLLLEAG